MDEAFFYNALAIHALGSYSTLKKIKEEYTSWEIAFHEMSATVDMPDAHAAWQTLERLQISLLMPSDIKNYPGILNEIPHPPFGIYIKGNRKAITSNKINFAIIGTRRATKESKDLAKKFAYELTNYHFTIISGLAFGIDAAGHQGCLEADGTTIAVFARGLDSIYPQSNATMGKQILINNGLWISEYPVGEPPLPYRFLERNRIISGLSKGILVIEAPEGSGSLATARFALEQNRDVFVIPGNVSHPNFKGSHELIRQGAALVTSPDEIAESYNIEKTPKKNKRKIPENSEEALVLMVLESSSHSLDVDKIIQMTRLEPRIVNRTITFLLLKEYIKEVEGGYTI